MTQQTSSPSGPRVQTTQVISGIAWVLLAVAGVASWTHLHDSGVEHGLPELIAGVLGLSPDVGAWATLQAIREPGMSPSGRLLCAVLLVGLLAWTGVANWEQASPGTDHVMSWGDRAWALAPLLLGAAMTALAEVLGAARRRSHLAAPTTAPSSSVARSVTGDPAPVASVSIGPAAGPVPVEIHPASTPRLQVLPTAVMTPQPASASASTPASAASPAAPRAVAADAPSATLHLQRLAGAAPHQPAAPSSARSATPRRSAGAASRVVAADAQPAAERRSATDAEIAAAIAATERPSLRSVGKALRAQGLSVAERRLLAALRQPADGNGEGDRDADVDSDVDLLVQVAAVAG